MEAYFKEELYQAVKNHPVIIYGAHLVAAELYRYIKSMYKEVEFLGFAVTSEKDNPLWIGKEKVAEISMYRNRTDAVILIAMPERYHDEVEKNIKKWRFHSCIRIGMEIMTDLKREQLLDNYRKQPEYPFRLYEDNYDGRWLNMTSNSKHQDEVYGLRERHYKFPVLYHLDIETVLCETKKFDFYKDYKRVLGTYFNLHTIPNDYKITCNSKRIKEKLRIYMVFSQWDSITTVNQKLPPWIYPIQAGSALSDIKSDFQLDETGINISSKNRVFAEMTAAYWIWKNVEKADYKGLCHYRRHFLITEEVGGLDINQVDVVLTTPRYAPGGIGRMFLAETPVKEPVYQNIFNSMEECCPEDVDAFRDYLEECLYYPNNMVIARSKIYDTYCEWIFQILFKMLETDTKSGYGHKEDRHIAYAAELLTSYFFVKHKMDYSIAVTDYIFYV